MGRIRSPSSFFFFNPPHFPRKSTALGLMAASRSMMVAALALPIPKLIMVIPSEVAAGMGTFRSAIDVFRSFVKSSRYPWKLVSRMYFPKLSMGIPVYLGSQFSIISCFVFIVAGIADISAIFVTLYPLLR